MTISDRRPIWLTPKMEEDLYLRWRELMGAVHRRGGMLVAHPKWSGLYSDFIARLMEDEFWTNAVGLLPDQDPMMVFNLAVPEDDLYAWTEKDGLQTPIEFFGNVGFGRLNWAAPRADGVMPWGEAKPSKAQRPVSIDAEDDDN